MFGVSGLRLYSGVDSCPLLVLRKVLGAWGTYSVSFYFQGFAASSVVVRWGHGNFELGDLVLVTWAMKKQSSSETVFR